MAVKTKQKELTVTLYAKASSFSKDGFEYSAFNGAHDMSTYGYMLLESHKVAFTIPADMTEREIAALRKEQQRIRAEAEEKNTRIEERIQSLLAIEFKPEGANHG